MSAARSRLCGPPDDPPCVRNAANPDARRLWGTATIGSTVQTTQVSQFLGRRLDHADRRDPARGVIAFAPPRPSGGGAERAVGMPRERVNAGPGRRSPWRNPTARADPRHDRFRRLAITGSHPRRVIALRGTRSRRASDPGDRFRGFADARRAIAKASATRGRTY